jgi:hypothetical protein
MRKTVFLSALSVTGLISAAAWAQPYGDDRYYDGYSYNRRYYDDGYAYRPSFAYDYGYYRPNYRYGYRAEPEYTGYYHPRIYHHPHHHHHGHGYMAPGD